MAEAEIITLELIALKHCKSYFDGIAEALAEIITLELIALKPIQEKLAAFDQRAEIITLELIALKPPRSRPSNFPVSRQRS